MNWSFHTIGEIHTPCKEKFGLPRQSGLVQELTGEIEIFSPYDRDEAFLALDSFSHIWVISVFHLAATGDWQPTVRPPRLGGNKRVGVFASRAPYRPNPLGLSVFRLLEITRNNGKLFLKIAGVDLVEGTPVLDIKPYLPYADSISSASGGYTDDIPRSLLSVSFNEVASKKCDELEAERYQGLRKLITELLAQDPRPAYKNEQQAEFGMCLYDLNIRFTITEGKVVVIGIESAF